MKDLNLPMFKQYDIRTKYKNVDDELKIRLYNAVALYVRDTLAAKSVVICRDARLNVPEIAEGLSKYLRRAGVDVFINPLPISTCQFYYTCMQHRDSAGIMVTASHNPAEYFGLKLVGPDVAPIAYGCGPEGGIAKIKELYEAGAAVEGDRKAKLTVINYLESYISYCMKLSGVKEGDLKGTRILLEFLNGSALLLTLFYG